MEVIMDINLKYGVNPHQKNAYLNVPNNVLKVLNGKPGYINMLDALSGWQLVKELKNATGKASAASFKHVSPAGAAVARKLSNKFLKSQFLKDKNYSNVAKAYIRARGGDRMSSYGDAACVSDVVDVSLAKYLKKEVSDLIIAPGYENEALDILKKKKRGKYLILQIDPSYEPDSEQIRDLYGFKLKQDRDNSKIDKSLFNSTKIVSENKKIDNKVIEDLIIGNITLKYTQSNSVCVVYDGQVIGNGAGQQSRVHCTRLASQKAEKWFLQQHPKVSNLNFEEGLKRASKTNLVDQFILYNQLSVAERKYFLKNLKKKPEILSDDEKDSWFKIFENISLVSDAFFPFRDSIDRAKKLNVKYISQPGGSIRDDKIIDVVNEYGMVMFFTGIRLFRH